MADNSFHSTGTSVPTKVAGCERGRRSGLSLLLLLVLLASAKEVQADCQTDG